MAGGDAQRSLLADAPDPDAGSRLDWLGIAGRVLQLVVAAAEVRTILRRQQADDLDTLLEHVEPLLDGGEGYPVGGVLHRVPARAEADLQPPAAELVDRGERVRENRGVAVAHAQDEDADADVLRLAGHRRHTGRGFEAA